MNTDIRIDWHSGMEITPQTFIEMENSIAEYRMMVRKMIAANNFGIIPRTKFSIIPEVFNDTVLIKQVDFDVLLPSGQIAVLESSANITLSIPDKDATELYLTVEMGDKINNFERGGIPIVANELKLDLKALAEIRNAVPLLKLVRNNDTWTVYDHYIMPVMTARSSVALLEKLEELKLEVQKIVEHEHAELLEDRVLVMILLEQLSNFMVDGSLRDLMLLCMKIVTALSYSVYKHKTELNPPIIMDVEPYLNAFKAFLGDITVAMNDLKPTVVEVVKEPEPEPEPEPKPVDEWMPAI